MIQKQNKEHVGFERQKGEQDSSSCYESHLEFVAFEENRRDITNTTPSIKKWTEQKQMFLNAFLHMRSYSIPNVFVASVACIFLFTNLPK